ncbi:hypothetical protein D3C73_1095990 [compost metagenome]
MAGERQIDFVVQLAGKFMSNIRNNIVCNLHNFGINIFEQNLVLTPFVTILQPEQFLNPLVICINESRIFDRKPDTLADNHIFLALSSPLNHHHVVSNYPQYLKLLVFLGQVLPPFHPISNFSHKKEPRKTQMNEVNSWLMPLKVTRRLHINDHL